MNYITLTPAYGRDYKSKAAVMEAWNANKDFEVANPGKGSYANKSDIENSNPRPRVEIRYDGLRKVVIL